MDRPGYITRCWRCYCILVVQDSFKGCDENRRLYDPDWVIAEHIRREH